jgi:LPPG:FO 2-phospho-L-lactate transferase
MLTTTTAPAATVSELHQEFSHHRIVLLAGGVGGAKLAEGLAQIVPPEQLTIIVNTGDDFQHAGLTICPDLDTVVYKLAGVANPETGWGRADESWRTITEIGRLGGPDWFRLGDLDLATHLTRSHLLAEGSTLTQVCQHLCRQLGVNTCVLPMCNEPAPTMIETDEGLLPFQTWFVARQWQPAVKKVHLPEDVRATPQVVAALERADIVVIAPSNPYVSVDPILNVYPCRAMIQDLPKLVVAVSPIVGGQAVKGPAAKMMREMGLAVTPATVAAHYQELIDVFVYDQCDEVFSLEQANTLLHQANTLMPDHPARLRLAQEIMQLSMELIGQ